MKRLSGGAVGFGMAIILTAIISACSRAPSIELTSVPKQQIPQAILDVPSGLVPEGKSLDDLGVVWRVCAPNNGRLMIAFTYNKMGDRNRPWLFVGSFPVDEMGKVVDDFHNHVLTMEFTERASTLVADGNHGDTDKDGHEFLVLHAGGMCLDARVFKIVGTTSSGKSVETSPIDGFWYLFIDRVATPEKWTKISGLDENGKVVVDLTPDPNQGRTP